MMIWLVSLGGAAALVAVLVHLLEALACVARVVPPLLHVG